LPETNIFTPQRRRSHSAGQTIAKLDTYELQRELTATLNTYRSTRDTFDQTQLNAQDSGIASAMAPLISGVNKNNASGIDDAVKRIVDQNQANLDNSVINVELANYALQLSTLTSPLKGIITHEDITVPGLYYACNDVHRGRSTVWFFAPTFRHKIFITLPKVTPSHCLLMYAK